MSIPAKPVQVGTEQFMSSSEAVVWLALYIATREPIKRQVMLGAYAPDIVAPISGNTCAIEVKLKGSMGSDGGPTEAEKQKLIDAATAAGLMPVMICGERLFNPAPEVWMWMAASGWRRVYLDRDGDGFYCVEEPSHRIAVERLFQFCYGVVRDCRDHSMVVDLPALRDKVRLVGTQAVALEQEVERRAREQREHMTKPMDHINHEPMPELPDYHKLIETAKLLPKGTPSSSAVVAALEHMSCGGSLASAIALDQTVKNSPTSHCGPLIRMMLIAMNGSIDANILAKTAVEACEILGVNAIMPRPIEWPHVERWREAQSRYAAACDYLSAQPPRPPLPKAAQLPPPASPRLAEMAHREAPPSNVISIADRLDKIRRDLAASEAALEFARSAAKRKAEIDAELNRLLDLFGP